LVPARPYFIVFTGKRAVDPDQAPTHPEGIKANKNDYRNVALKLKVDCEESRTEKILSS
jgi:hypothetical protein